MKTAWLVFSLTLLINLLLLLGFVGYLYSSGRLSRERLRAAVDIFRLPIAEQLALEAEQERLAEQQRRQAEELARLQAVSQGPLTLQQRLDATMQVDDMTLERFNLLKNAKADLEAYFDLVRTEVEKKQARLDERRRAFEQMLESERQRRQDENFRQAVAFYEQITPRQAKQMFQELIAQGRTEQVVDYLAAMQLRKAAGVLKQFKDGNEVRQAAELLQRLRQRGINAFDTKSLDTMTSTSGTAS